VLRRRVALYLVISGLTIQACKGSGDDEAARLMETFARPEFQGGSDGWGAARRRRLLTQYLVKKGVSVETVTEGRSFLNPNDKYRKVHLLAKPRGALARKTINITYVIDASEQNISPAAQLQCDRLLRRQLVTVQQHNPTNLRFGMDNRCLTPAGN